MKPLQRATVRPTKFTDIYGENDKECWKNDQYTVIVNRDIETEIGLMTWLSIRRDDRKAARDWRHFQWIKNQLVGPENEAVELFPAEARLVDGANQYHLWVLQSTTDRFPFGFTERIVSETTGGITGAVQRPFPADRRPGDLEAMEQKARAEVARVAENNKIAKLAVAIGRETDPEKRRMILNHLSLAIKEKLSGLSPAIENPI